MGYYNEIFIEENGQLNHVGSSDGSNTPDFFDGVKSLKDWENAISNLQSENNYWPRKEGKHPFPWGSYKTSDNLIVLRKCRRWKLQIWKPEFLVWVDEFRYNDKYPQTENSAYFISLDNKYRMYNDEYKPSEKDVEILQLPILKRNKIKS